jgi:hypothetical protein
MDRWPRSGSIKEQEERAMHRNVLRVLATMVIMLGLLTLGVTPTVAQEEPTVEVTIDQATIDPRTGEVTLTGTATCSGLGSQFAFVEIFGDLRQDVGGGVWAPFYVVTPCPPEGATFSQTFTAVQGSRLRPGPAHLTAVIIGCVPEPIPPACSVTFSELLDTTIRLTPARNA